MKDLQIGIHLQCSSGQTWQCGLFDVMIEVQQVLHLAFEVENGVVIENQKNQGLEVSLEDNGSDLGGVDDDSFN